MWGNNIEVDLKEIEWECVWTKFILSRMRTSGLDLEHGHENWGCIKLWQFLTP
jgi:hypothetical protein